MSTSATRSIGNILVPFTGAAGSAGLLNHAVQTVGTAGHFTLMVVDGASEAEARELLSSLAQSPGGHGVDGATIEVVSRRNITNLAESICTAADEIQADLILWAIPEHGKCLLADPPDSCRTTGEELALSARVPVIIVRDDMPTNDIANDRPSRILVPLDGSATSALAIAPATRLASQLQAAIHLVMVIDPMTALPPAYAYMPLDDFDRQDAMNALQREANDVLNRSELAVRAAGAAVTSELLLGTTGQCLVAAIKLGDVVVMTTHGKGNAVHSRFGSMALHIVRHSPVPVVVIHPQVVAARTGRGSVVWEPHAASTGLVSVMHQCL